MKTNIFQHLRLAGFPLGLGLTSVLVSGTLNRVMIVELGIPAAAVGAFFALPLLISPLRIWLGYQSDSRPLFGLRREPFIILGSMAAGLGVVGATLAVLRAPSLNAGVVAVVVAAFLLYGAGKNLSSNTFEALLADKFTGEARPRAVTLFKVAMFVGIMLGALLLGKALTPFSPSRLLGIAAGAVALAFVLAVLGVVRQEPRKASVQSEVAAAKKVPFWETFTELVWADPQIRRFFIFVMLTVVGTLGQDVLLEPYAALALGMSVGATTNLTAVWGAGTLLSMGAAGMCLVRKYSYVRVVRVGLILGVGTFAGLILTGAFGLTAIFWVLVFLLGVSTGFSASGMLSAVIDFTTPARAGLLMGVWGVAHNLGQAIGGLVSGGIVDLVRALQGDVLLAYGVVFTFEAVLLLLALRLLNRVNIREARVLSESMEPAD